MSGPERAAVLMLALGDQYGGRIWGMLDDDELRQLSVVMCCEECEIPGSTS